MQRLGWAAAAISIPEFLRPFASLAIESEPQHQPDATELAAMAEIASRFMSDHRVPGMSVAIARRGQLLYRTGFGFADQEKGEKVTPQHLFRIASVTKPITSVAIFTLIEKGKLALGDLVFGSQGVLHFDYGPRYPEPVEKITIEHLLTHTCGGWGNDKNDPMFIDPTVATQELIAQTVQHAPLQNEPGSRFNYSNFGYCILGRVIEKISGQSYDEFVLKNILSRCQVDDMRIAGNTRAEKATNEVLYYDLGGDDPYRYNIRRMDSHGGWLATSSDLVQFAMRVDGFSETPDILNENTIRTMTTPSRANPLYAKGWSVTEQPNWWHSGSLPGTTTILVRTASGLCWSALTNARSPQLLEALDETIWKMARAVPAWKA